MPKKKLNITGINSDKNDKIHYTNCEHFFIYLPTVTVYIMHTGTQCKITH